MKIAMILCAFVGLALGLPEKPGPYPAKGWKPQGARLELPNKYGPPRDQRPDDIEITTSTNDYVPPTSTEKQSDENDVLRVQGLPAADAVSQFNNFQQKQSTKVDQQTARIQAAPSQAFVAQPFLLSPLFAPQFASVSGQLQIRPIGKETQTQEFDNPKNDVQQLPARAYGPPQTNNNVPQQPEPESPQNETSDDNNEDEEESDEPAVAVANAESSAKLVQEAQQGQVGQYYILLPDSSLQKVRFATRQTVEDREINGFSAQLR